MATPNSSDKKAAPPAYVSSSGSLLESPPLAARVSRFVDDTYNFFGLYFVSLFSLDPYTAAQNSQFNTRSRPNARQERPRWGGGSSRVGGGGPSGGSGPSAGNPGPRRWGGVDDVRGPECGSCG